MEWLKAIQWDDPAIVGPVAVALTVGLLKIIPAIIKRKKPSDGSAASVNTTVNPEFTVAPQTNIENRPSNVLKSTVKVGLDEKAVGQEVGKAVDPLRQVVAAGRAEIQALSKQMAAQLAPKQPLPDSEDPLKVKAVEFFNAGVDAYKKGEIGQAIGHWLDALKLAPAYAHAHNNLGLALKDKGELEAAIEQYNAALRIDPDLSAAHNNLGNALKDKGELDAAIEQYSTALRIDPDNATAHNNLGNALNAKGEFDAAIKQYKAALRIEPDYATAYTNLGAALTGKGEFDAAIEHHNAALRIEPNLAAAHFNLACALAQRKDAVAAVAALGKAIELDSKYRDEAKSDSDFDPIRDDPAFRKLLDAD